MYISGTEFHTDRTSDLDSLNINSYTFMRRLTTGILSEKCIVRRFRRCANVIECTYTNLDSTIPNYNQQDATFLDLFISTDAVHVSGGSSAHHQEHTTVHAASGIVNQYCCLLLAWTRWNSNSNFHLFHASSKKQYWLVIP